MVQIFTPVSLMFSQAFTKLNWSIKVVNVSLGFALNSGGNLDSLDLWNGFPRLALRERRSKLKLFRSKLCIVGFDWIAAAAVDSTRATFNPHIFQESLIYIKFYLVHLFKVSGDHQSHFQAQNIPRNLNDFCPIWSFRCWEICFISTTTVSYWSS